VDSATIAAGGHATMKKSALLALVLLLSVLHPAARAMTITRIFSFDTASGWRPEGPLLEASDGNFYGTASLAGDDGNGCATTCVGTVFKLTPQGQYTILHTFTGGGTTPSFANGNSPRGGLVEGPDGYLYGTTYSGGAAFNQYGIVYKISKTGAFQKIHDFCPSAPCPNGANPVGSLAWGPDGYLYGTTTAPIIKPYIFKITPSGSYTAIAHFQDNPLGAPSNGLLRASDGQMYGVARNGVFRVSPAGVITPLYFFGAAPDGSNGQGPLIEGTDGNLYGVTLQGGANGQGTVFKITTSGTYTKIFDITAAVEGVFPNAVCQMPDTRLWGTTSNNSAATGGGAVYSITTSGTFQEASFLNTTTGFTSIAPVIQASDGKLYGTTTAGGQFGSGTVFVVDAGLPAPVPGEASADASMRAAGYDDGTGDITITYDAACFATDHHVVYGPLSSVATYGYSGQACNLGKTGIATFNPGTGSYFWVAVGNTATLEGSYGRRTGGIERPSASGLPGCDYTQDLSAACP
jgi:uncharacterized repeat protein (TIGR03803 family)